MSESKTLYAVVDIETSGGKPTDTKITEIAIYISDGEKIIEEYSSLVNPQRPIDWYVIKLTKITNEMVAKAPTFEQLADKIRRILEGKVFVAHNADFDYNIVKREFLEIGQPYESQKLCTVKASRKIYPQFASHSLGNICVSLDIPLDNAHRAAEDAKATTLLLHNLLQQSDLSFLQSELNSQNYVIELPQDWTIKGDKEILPQNGIIYYHNDEGEIIYIDSTNNVQKRLYNIINPDKKHEEVELKVIENTKSLSIDYTCGKFKAEIKSINDIQALKPIYNKRMKPQSEYFTMYPKEDEHGLYYLHIIKKEKVDFEIETPEIYSHSHKNAERIKAKIMQSTSLESLQIIKKEVHRLEGDAKLKLVDQYNRLLMEKIYKEFCCKIKEGYFVFEINPENEVEAVKVSNHYIESWGQGQLIDNQIKNYRVEFDIERNQKLTRKFLNLLPKVSYKVIG